MLGQSNGGGNAAQVQLRPLDGLPGLALGLGDVLVDGAVLGLAVEFLQRVDDLSADDFVVALVFGDHAGLQLPQLLLGLVLLALQLQQLGGDELHDLLALADLVAAAVPPHLRRPLPRLLVLLALVEDLQLLRLDQVGTLPLLGQPQRVVITILVDVVVDEVLDLDLGERAGGRVGVLGLLDDGPRHLEGVLLLLDDPEQAGLRLQVVVGHRTAELKHPQRRGIHVRIAVGVLGEVDVWKISVLQVVLASSIGICDFEGVHDVEQHIPFCLCTLLRVHIKPVIVLGLHLVMLVLEVGREEEGSALTVLALLLYLIELRAGLVFRGEALHENREAEAALLSFHLFDHLLLLAVELGDDVDGVVFFAAEAVVIILLDAVEDPREGEDQVPDVFGVVRAQQDLAEVFYDELRGEQLVDHEEGLLEVVAFAFVGGLEGGEFGLLLGRGMRLFGQLVEDLLELCVLGVVFVDVEGGDEEEAHQFFGIVGPARAQDQGTAAVSIFGEVGSVQQSA